MRLKYSRPRPIDKAIYDFKQKQRKFYADY